MRSVGIEKYHWDFRLLTTGGGGLSDYRTIELSDIELGTQTIRLSDIGLQKYYRFPSSE
jgi:hypothetical protein